MSKYYTILDENNYNCYINKQTKSIKDFEMTKINYYGNNLTYMVSFNELSHGLVSPIKPENKIHYGDRYNHIFIGNTYHKYLSFVSSFTYDYSIAIYFSNIRNSICNSFIDVKKDYINEGIQMFKVYSKDLNTKLFI